MYTLDNDEAEHSVLNFETQVAIVDGSIYYDSANHIVSIWYQGGWVELGNRNMPSGI